MVLPRMFPLVQKFPQTPPLDIGAVVKEQMAKIQVRRGARIAVGVGSRGIANLEAIVRAVTEALARAGALPYIVPAMGSHGGATAEGQEEVLAGYGITRERLGVPIRSSMASRLLGKTLSGLDVYWGEEALAADGVIAVNRVKPHTDFLGRLGSGIQKMIAIGFGKREGAAACHAAASRIGHEAVIREVAGSILARGSVLGGVAIVENFRHQTARIEALLPAEIERREAELIQEATGFMPRLPFDDIDLLIVDRIGKNISGCGMDPNVIGRSAHGYSSRLSERPARGPVIRRIFVRDLSAETSGNAIGVGLADFTTSRLVRAFDPRKTYTNSITALTPQLSKLPIHFEADREAVEAALSTLAMPEPAGAKVLRILDTLTLDRTQASEAYRAEAARRPELEALGEPAEMTFDRSGNLPPL